MTKHQTLTYLKYGKIISKINDKIKNTDIKSDMIKFLAKFPGNIKYPADIYQPIRPISKKYGKFIFEITKSYDFLSIDFDGNNSFKIYPHNKWPYNNSDYYITCASIDDIDHYVELYPNYFNKIIEYYE